MLARLAPGPPSPARPGPEGKPGRPASLIQHVSGEDNVVADALSRRADHDDGSLHRRAVQTALAKQAFAATGNDVGPSLHAAVVVDASDLLEEIRRAYSADADCVELLREPERHSYNSS